LFTTGSVNIDPNYQSDSKPFEINQTIAQDPEEDFCEGSCVSAESWQYCVAYSEIRWGNRNRTAQEAEECEENDGCTGTEICDA
jgi:hypothetical protein